MDRGEGQGGIKNTVEPYRHRLYGYQDTSSVILHKFYYSQGRQSMYEKRELSEIRLQVTFIFLQYFFSQGLFLNFFIYL